MAMNTVVIPWNNVMLDAVRRLGGAPGPIAYMGAMMHIAMFEAANALDGSRYESYLAQKGAEVPSTPSPS